MLLDNKISNRFIDTLKLGVESTIIELYLFDNRGAFNVVMISNEF